MSQDVLIVGAGPAGLSFARLLADTGLKITLLEKQSEKSLANPAYDGREIALTHLSQKIMSDCGMWQRLPEDEIALIRDARVMNRNSPQTLNFDHEDSGKDFLGYMVSNHMIRKVAYEEAMAHKNIKLIPDVEVTEARTDADGAWVKLSNGKTLESKLLVAADSRFSSTRDMIGIGADRLKFNRTCIVCRMKHQRSHRDTAYECFLDECTLAILPLNKNHCSVVVTIDADKSDAIMAMTPAAFEQFVMTHAQNRLGKMELTSKLYAYPLVAVYAQQFYGQRFALMGDAAVGMHPVTAHGFNFGLRGAQTLANELTHALDLGLDVGDAGALVRYHHKHVLATKPIYLGTNMLVKIYTKTTPLAKLARQSLLLLGNALPPVKRAIMNQLTEVRAV